MLIQDIRLQNFRSYVDESFEVDPGVNIIVGPNASGKTNILEAILVGCLGKSYRARDTELVRFNQPWSRIDIHTEQGLRTVKLVTAPGDTVKKDFIIQDQSYKRLSITKTIPVVLFEPNHLQLMTGSPDLRREYMDDLLEQLVGGYATTRRQYRRALAQRNRLLKLDRDQIGTQLFAWNIRLSQLAAEVVKHRLTLLESLSAGLEGLYRELSNTDAQVSLSYTSSCNQLQYGSDMLHKLEAHTEQDFIRGFTAYGPHRDDMTITLKDKSLLEAASRGETRTMLLAIKIQEMKLIEESRLQKPLLLLDDVFSELDGARRRALTEVLSNYQVFLTTTDADVVVEHFLGKCNVLPLR